MPESVLTLLKLCLVAVLYLFFFRVLRAVWFEMKPPAAVPPPPAAPAPSARPSAAPAPKPAAGAPARRLTVTAPPGLAGQTFELTDAELTVGRAQGCAVLLGDPTVSSIHARVAAQGAERIIEDLKSRNGTFVNRKRLTAPTPLRAGDIVGIGPVVTLEAG